MKGKLAAGLVLLLISLPPGAYCAVRSRPNIQQATQTKQSDLTEAVRLNAEVVKLYNSKKYDEALALGKTALETSERAGNQPVLATALINLGEIYMAKRKYSESLTMYRRLLPIYEKRFGAVHEQTAIIVDSLALLEYLNNNLKAAEPFYLRAVSIREQVFGAEGQEGVEPIHKLAEFYRSQKQFEKAEPLFLRAIEILDKAPPDYKPEKSNVMERYLCFLYESRSYEKAQKAEQELNEKRRAAFKRKGGRIAEGSGVLNGKAISLAQPAYPVEARREHIRGVVRIHILLDEKGKVIQADFVCGPSVFASAALAAAYQSRFSSTKLSGMPVQVNGVILYNFQ
jgi:tetratricopeptide (TPR) repeat protein